MWAVSAEVMACADRAGPSCTNTHAPPAAGRAHLLRRQRARLTIAFCVRAAGPAAVQRAGGGVSPGVAMGRDGRAAVQMH